MGIRTRIKRRLKKIRALFEMVAEEARHPGRPQPHMAARNPLWGGEPDQPPPNTPTSPTPAPTPDNPAPDDPDPFAPQPQAGDDDYWFLKDNEAEDGWRVTNPGQADPAEDE